MGEDTRDDPFSIRGGEEQASTGGRAWRYKLPRLRLFLAGGLLIVGFILCIIGLALTSLACGVSGVIMFAPGAFATYTYWRILKRGGQGVNLGQWLEIEEVT